jgi:hypothetical protein
MGREKAGWAMKQWRIVWSLKHRSQLVGMLLDEDNAARVTESAREEALFQRQKDRDAVRQSRDVRMMRLAEKVKAA